MAGDARGAAKVSWTAWTSVEATPAVGVSSIWPRYRAVPRLPKHGDAHRAAELVERLAGCSPRVFKARSFVPSKPD
jgi:hypothetical protein